MKKKQIVSLVLAAAMVVSSFALAGCGGKGGNDGGGDGADGNGGGTSGKDANFSWWISTTDGGGTYYEEYDDNPAVQWLNQQYWDTENGTIGTEENGRNVKFTFTAPVSGSEQDNFNVMMSTGEYTDIVDITMGTETSKTWYEEGVALDLTEYVEKWCPNYVEYLDENPDVKALVTDTDEDGKTHYYQMSCIMDGIPDPWCGYAYRRDWIVAYGTPSSHVWDWDSDYVKKNGHPAVTPLSEAKAQDNMEGWKENEVTSFTSSEGENPDDDYEDNVIFPSGKDYPYTISDWEWMFEAFEKALADMVFSEDTTAYCTTVGYMGYDPLGELVSSFGAGTGDWIKDKDNNAKFMGDSEEFKTYLECLSNWNQKGWLDKSFEQRASDLFYIINTGGVMQGKVGLFFTYSSTAGTGIRSTCADPVDQQNAFVMGCPLPVNDVYGEENSKFVTPNSVFQAGRVDTSVIVTEKAEDKDLEALFTVFNWLYSREGAATRTLGLSKEQLDSANLEHHNVYADQNLDGAYVLEEKDGKTVYNMNFPDGVGDFAGALVFARMAVGLRLCGDPNGDYIIDNHKAKVISDAQQFWAMYENTASLMNYASLYTTEETDANGPVNTEVWDYAARNLPALIKSGDLSGWDAYVEGLNALNPEIHTKNDQAMLDRLYR